MIRHTHFRTLLVSILITLGLLVGGSIAPAAAQSGGTPPILVVVNDAAPNKFGRYLGEILRAEGLNSFDIASLGSVTDAQIAQYKVAILAETPLSGAQATLLTNYVNAGGYLIAMRPDAQIKNLFGLNTASGTQTDGYLKMSGTGPSQGLNTSTLQIHGTTDRYTTAVGAVTFADLYSNATTASGFPVVVSDATGHGIAFMYDLARNIVYTRQGNPANANVDTDGDTVLRTIDLFQATGGGSTWVDLNKMPIPQADEQQRLFARLVQQAINASQPMPQLWYFPDTAKTVMVSTGDAHANPPTWYQSVIDMHNTYGAKITFYISIGGGLTNDQVQVWRTQGHEVGIHPPSNKPDPYPPFNIENLNQGYDVYNSWFSMTFSSDPSRTVRNHQVAWQGWTDAAEIAANHGYAMDTNFYSWGGWLQKPDNSWARGYVTGSGQPMKFIKADGTIVPYYQQLTTLIDEQWVAGAGAGSQYENLSSANAIAASQQLIDASLAGDYAALMTQFHVDYFGTTSSWVNGTLAYAQSHGVPVWTADQWLTFTESRYNANYTNIAWDNGSKTLSFSLNGPTAAGMNLSSVVPLVYDGSSLSAVTVDGAPASFSIQTIKGVQVAFITTAAGNHTVTAVYQGSPLPPTNTPTFTPTFTPTSTPTDTPTNTPTPTATSTGTVTPEPTVGCFVDDTFANFSLGTNSSTFVSEDNGGQVILAPTLIEDFSGVALPAAWTGTPWSAGGSTTVSGGSLAVEVARAGSNATYGTNVSLEALATFGASQWQHVGWVGDFDFNQNWAIFSTFNTTNQLYARTSNGTNTLIAGNWLGTAHRYRIDRTATQAIFSIDGVQVATHAFNFAEPMRPLFSDNSPDSIPVRVDRLTLTPYAASGTFTSRVYDAGSTQSWGAVTYTTSGSTVAISARSGNTAAPDGTWSGFTTVASSGSTLGLNGRYIQYQAALSTADTSLTPVLESISFACSPATGNQPPTVGAAQSSVIVNEGQPAANSGTYSDPESDTLTLSASVGTVTDNGNGTWSWSYATNDGPSQSTTVTITATDSTNNNSGQITFTLTVTNMPPTATFANSSGQIVAGGSATLTFSNQADASTVDTTAGFVYSYDCTNDGSFELTASTSPTFNCPYPAAGTFDVLGRIADKDGGFTDTIIQITVTPLVVTPSPTPLPTATFTPIPPAVSGCFVDDALVDFSQGTNSSTFISEVSGGQVILAPTVGENFAGAALPASWSGAPWNTGGTTTVSGSALAVEVARAGTNAAYSANTSLEFAATFGASPWQHGGWLSDFNFEGVWAIFSTMGTTNQLYARTNNGTNTLIAGNWLGTAHQYRIDRSATQALFYIDGALVATHSFPYGDTTRPIFSDNSADSIPLSVDWVRVTPYAASGTFTSRVFDAIDEQNWGVVTYEVTGTTAVISARTGNTAAPDGSWSAFTTVASSGSTLGLSGRYIQYRAELSSADTTQTPALEAVGFACAPIIIQPPTNQAPTISVDQANIAVSEGQSANNTGVYNDPENAAVTLSASVGTVTDNGNGTWSWSYATSDGPAQNATVTITVTDNGSLSAQTTFALAVNNVAPSATFSNTTGTINAGQSAAFTFTGAADASSVDTSSGFVYSYDCSNDGSFELSGSTSATFNCNYPTGGTFTAAGRITDKDGGASDYTAQVEVITPQPTATNTPTETPLPTATNTPVTVVGCFVDDTLADFSLGTVGSATLVSDINGGRVTLKPALSQYFIGTTMPSGWTSTNWVTGGSSTLANGLLTVQGARTYTTTTYGVNRSLEFVATFGAAASQQIGWAGSATIGNPWAVFSTHNTTNQLYTRTSNGVDTLIPGNWIGTPHKYRIHRTSTQSAFYIDDVLVSTHALSSTANARPMISDATLDAIPLTVDWATVTPYSTSGTYTSRVFDAGATTNWGAVTFVTSGTTITISARTSALPTSGWSAYTTIASSGTSLGRSSRYIQYRAVMSTASNVVSPSLENISFACSTSAPSAQSIQVQPVQTLEPAPLVPTFTPAPTETLAPTETPIDVPTVEAPTAVPTDIPTVEAPTAVPTDVPTATLAPTNTLPPPAAPIAAFTVSTDNGPAPLAIQFVNGSTGEINGYAWSFGDGGSSLDANPSYTFATPGTYTVTLTVSGPGGAASAQTVITVS